jgi:hypothetical protein
MPVLMPMKPLILWARNRYPQPYGLRLLQREGERLVGMVRIDQEWLPFVYDGQRREITLGEGPASRRIRLNEWGQEV